MPQGRQPLLPLIDRLLDGKLADYLTEHRTAGLSFDAIGRRLANEHDVNVTGETVRRWCVELGVEEAA